MTFYEYALPTSDLSICCGSNNNHNHNSVQMHILSFAYSSQETWMKWRCEEFVDFNKSWWSFYVIKNLLLAFDFYRPNICFLIDEMALKIAFVYVVVQIIIRATTMVRHKVYLLHTLHVIHGWNQDISNLLTSMTLDGAFY
jgi:hypothetical protein